jgi:simple sugar transport system ATP-binding protein
MSLTILSVEDERLAGAAVCERVKEAANQGRAVLLVSLELDEVRSLSDRILVIYEGEIVGDFDSVAMEELGLYMAGAKKKGRKESAS